VSTSTWIITSASDPYLSIRADPPTPTCSGAAGRRGWTRPGRIQDVVAALEAGGDEYPTKPVDHAALIARVKSMLRIKSLHDTVQEQT
jgi:hypothetical protein